MLAVPDRLTRAREATTASSGPRIRRRTMNLRATTRGSNLGISFMPLASRPPDFPRFDGTSRQSFLLLWRSGALFGRSQRYLADAL
jgi:hypothetical protein